MPKDRMLTSEPFANLSRDEQLLEVARANLKQYGSIAPPPEIALRVQTATCKNCGKTGSVGELFGIKKQRGKVLRQSWCRACRGSKAAHPGREGKPLKKLSKKAAAARLSPEEQKTLNRLLAKAKGG